MSMTLIKKFFGKVTEEVLTVIWRSQRQREESMSLSTQPWSWQKAVVWLVVITIAAVVYFSGISHELIWYDESVAVAIANHGFADIFALLPAENHPPLYFLLLRAAIMIFGNSEWALRFISAAAAVGMVALGAGPVRRIFGDRTALLYAVVVLFTPIILIQAHEARMY
jgi:4-amino-4-deoxy-L-arabinose transferase-like glycosyltransferase